MNTTTATEAALSDLLAERAQLLHQLQQVGTSLMWLRSEVRVLEQAQATLGQSWLPPGLLGAAALAFAFLVLR